MKAEKNLHVLLASMQAALHEQEYVFCSLSKARFSELDLSPLASFQEKEGISLVLEKSDADRLQISYQTSWALITCKVVSDLSAIGFLAAMSGALADAGISVNAVSAYYHDHLFVPWQKRHLALDTLQKLAASDMKLA